MRSSKARFIVFAVVPLVLLPVTMPSAAGARRNPGRCTQACHQVQSACDDRSDALCQEMFGENGEKYVACRIASKTVCLDLDKDCRMFCQSTWDGLKSEP